MTRILRIARERGLAVVALGLFLGCGPAFAQTALDTAATSDSSASVQDSLELRGVIAALPTGAPWLVLSRGAFCAYGPDTQVWTAGRAPQRLSLYSEPFKSELEKAGFKIITPGEDNLFDPEAGAADYQVAAVITDEHIHGCVSAGGIWGEGNGGDVKGDSAMTVDWQIYSPIKKQVVARVTTSASAKLDKATPGGVARLVAASFAANVGELAASVDFKAAVSAAKPLTKGFVLPGQQSKIVLSGSLKAPKREIADAVGSVVTLLTGAGTGSGVLVSDDGYILSDAHVVGDEKDVRVRWSDGIEAVGRVVRIAKDRDIAIVKTDARDRMPLAIKRGAVNPGQRVYAIGSPKDKRFQGTVSSGVVSATRIFDGLRFIRSDVSVSPGSSGGPLLDETGAVLGLTVLGVDNGGRAGLNLFIPIGDAMDFLALEQQ